MPIFWICIYSWTGKLVFRHSRVGKAYCSINNLEFHGIFLWISLYLFTPSAVLVIFNIAICIRLRRARKLHKSLEQQCVDQAFSYRLPMNRSLPTSEVSMTTTSINHTLFTSESDESTSTITTSNTSSETTGPSEHYKRIEVKSGLR